MSRLRAAGEVLLALAHVAFRAFRRFTALGQLEVRSGWTLSPGIALAATALLALACRPRGSAGAHGLHLRGAVHSVGSALVAMAVLAAFGVLALAAGIDLRPAAMGPRSGVLVFAGGLLATAATLLVLERADARPARAPPGPVLAILALLLLLPTLIAALGGRELGPVLQATTWRFFAAGCGEEVFFRGYAQARLDAAFGRGWRWAGVAFGPGLPLAALLFGFVHVLNPYDYFGGGGEFAWWHGLTTVSMPYGFLFARCGSVVAPAVLHGLVDVLPLLFAAPPA